LNLLGSETEEAAKREEVSAVHQPERGEGGWGSGCPRFSARPTPNNGEMAIDEYQRNSNRGRESD